MALKPNTILINACRGPVVDNSALLEVLKMRHDLSVVLDVWEPEPDLSLALLDKVDIATPHIAGYTLEGKARGTTRCLKHGATLLVSRSRCRSAPYCRCRNSVKSP